MSSLYTSQTHTPNNNPGVLPSVKGTFVAGDIGTSASVIVSDGTNTVQTYPTQTIWRTVIDEVETDVVTVTSASGGAVDANGYVNGGYLSQNGTGQPAVRQDGTLITYNTFFSSTEPANYQGVYSPTTQYSAGESVSLSELNTPPFYTVEALTPFVGTKPYCPNSFVSEGYTCPGGQPAVIANWADVGTLPVGTINAYTPPFQATAYWKNITGNTSANPPPADTLNWAAYTLYWESGTTYESPNFVVYQARLYSCLSAAFVSTSPPSVDTVNWALSTPLWSPSGSYAINEYVIYLGSLYRNSTGTNTTVAPPQDITNWNVAAFVRSDNFTVLNTSYSRGLFPPFYPQYWILSTTGAELTEIVNTNPVLGTGFAFIAQSSVDTTVPPRPLALLGDEGFAVGALQLCATSVAGGILDPTIGEANLIPAAPSSAAVITNSNITPDSLIFLTAYGCRGPLSVKVQEFGTCVVVSPNILEDVVEGVPVYEPDFGNFKYLIINPAPFPRGVPLAAPPPPPPPPPSFAEVEAARIAALRGI